ncbi:MAG: hypothetical protein IPL08_13355 [Saprospiraceae bacterium]|nr:hypothetical protein [Saprospiraceae bacterium]
MKEMNIVQSAISPRTGNVQLEVGINTELGLLVDLIKDKISGQIAGFSNRIVTSFLSDRRKFGMDFDKLGTIR